jgi:hypothetical protein
MEGFQYVIFHSHELVIYEGWNHVPRYEAINGPHSVVQTE